MKTTLSVKMRQPAGKLVAESPSKLVQPKQAAGIGVTLISVEQARANRLVRQFALDYLKGSK